MTPLLLLALGCKPEPEPVVVPPAVDTDSDTDVAFCSLPAGNALGASFTLALGSIGKISVLHSGDNKVWIGTENGEVEEWDIPPGDLPLGPIKLENWYGVKMKTTALAHADDATFFVGDDKGIVGNWTRQTIAPPRLPHAYYLP